MSIIDRIKGKSDFEITIMDLQDVLHTLRKNGIGQRNTQDAYALSVMEDCIGRLHRMNSISKLKELGHELLEPANQYCKKCGCAVFTKEGTKPCKGGERK